MAATPKLAVTMSGPIAVGIGAEAHASRIFSAAAAAPIIVRARFEPGHDVGQGIMAGQQEDVEVARKLRVPDTPAQRRPDDTRHIPVRNQQLEAPAQNLCDRLVSILRRLNNIARTP
jgi:hypothetical protein